MEEKIKCHLCNGIAELKFEELKLDDGQITIKNSPYYKCTNCKEEFVTKKQMQELDEKINTKFAFKRSIINAGRSLALTLPSDLAENYNLKKGNKIKLIPQDKKHIIIQLP